MSAQISAAIPVDHSGHPDRGYGLAGLSGQGGHSLHPHEPYD